MSRKYALISVSDKSDIEQLAAELTRAGYQIISTGGTAKFLAEAGFDVVPVEDITAFPECMDGRLKTLHPRVAGGLLGVRDNPAHMQAMADHNIPAIDVLVVNLYPFSETISGDHTLEDAIENIDIGGPTMIRAAAKNYKYVAVVTDPADYVDLVKRVHEEDFRHRLAAKAFRHTAAYDATIAKYLTEEAKEDFPKTLTLTYRKHSDLRYGENPHQAAAYYVQNAEKTAELLHGKQMSYNNIADANAAVALAQEFKQPVCVAVKHSTPCGVAIGKGSHDAYKAAYECDPQSIFGGIVAFNCQVDKPCAELMFETFLEVIIAPAFAPDALEVLAKKKNLRLMLASKHDTNRLEFKSVASGLLMQEVDTADIEQEDFNLVTQTPLPPSAREDLVFAMKVVKHVKSNAIVVAKSGQLLGQGGGEVSRIWAAKAALERAGSKAFGAVLASDALFPFPDVVEACAEAGIAAIIQPGGSKNDGLSIDAANKHGIAMVFTGIRHFKH